MSNGIKESRLMKDGSKKISLALPLRIKPSKEALKYAQKNKKSWGRLYNVRVHTMFRVCIDTYIQ
jgi:hypothetical protein